MIKNYFALMLSVIGLWAMGQKHKMVLHKNGNSFYEVNISEIDSVTFEVIATNDDTAGTFTDSRDGNEYKWVKIGDQVWMAENLKYLPKVNRVADGSEDTDYKGSYYYVYDYDGTDVNEAKATSNYKTYGVLYNWDAATGGSSSSASNPSGVQGACPSGWHLPSDAEWTQLTDYLSVSGDSVAGGKLKEAGTTHWRSPNTGATNETGFTALPGGNRSSSGAFHNIGGYGPWWSATEAAVGLHQEYGATNAWSHSMMNSWSHVSRGPSSKEVGRSVRCVRD
jgi:uncharacterized protein (TIGR02145 family)